jgi:hypothetical protein
MLKPRPILVITLVFITSFSFAQGKLLNKMLAKVSKKMGNANVVTTSTLDDIVPLGGVESNLHTSELGTLSQSFFDGWQTGGEQVAFTFFKKNTDTFFKIDGTVTIDGQPVEYVSVGTYSMITPPKGTPRKIEIATSSGQKSSFAIAPSPYSFKIVSINGQKEKISLDLSKDVVIEIEGALPPDQLLKVNLAINQVSIKALYAVCYIRSGSTLTIPAAAFRNINIKPAGGAVYGYKKSFLSVGVESQENATDVSGNIPAIQYTRLYNDGKLVNITTEPNLNTGMEAKGKESLKAGEMNYEFIKLNAFMSRPSSQLKKIGVVSTVITGKTFAESSVITQEEDATKGEAKITKTTTLEFPVQSDAVWTAALKKIYPEITAIIQTELGASVSPVDAMMQTPAYKSVENFFPANKNVKEEFSLAYPNTKLVSGIPSSETIGVNSVNERMLKESGMDALMIFTLDLQVEQDDDFGVLVPKLTVELIGKINGLSTPTKYFTGTVSGKGVRSENIGLKVVFESPTSVMGDLKGRNDKKIYHVAGTITPDELDALIRRSDLITMFKKGLQDIIGKEKANPDYETVWNLRK